jgi:hypothetical protein
MPYSLIYRSLIHFLPAKHSTLDIGLGRRLLYYQNKKLEVYVLNVDIDFVCAHAYLILDVGGKANNSIKNHELPIKQWYQYIVAILIFRIATVLNQTTLAFRSQGSFSQPPPLLDTPRPAPYLHRKDHLPKPLRFSTISWQSAHHLAVDF